MLICARLREKFPYCIKSHAVHWVRPKSEAQFEPLLAMIALILGLIAFVMIKIA